MKVIETTKILDKIENRMNILKAENIENAKPENMNLKRARENQLRMAELNRMKDMVNEIISEPQIKRMYELRSNVNS